MLAVADQFVADLDQLGPFLRFLRGFGDLTFTAGETPVPGFPDLNVVSNVGRTRPPRSVFHVDTSYVRRPPAYTALRAVQIPQRGGETLFSNQYRAYSTLPPDVRAALDGRTILHRVSGVAPGQGAETEAEHPVFRVHPVSGRTARTSQCGASISAASASCGQLRERVLVVEPLDQVGVRAVPATVRRVPAPSRAARP